METVRSDVRVAVIAADAINAVGPHWLRPKALALALWLATSHAPVTLPAHFGA